MTTRRLLVAILLAQIVCVAVGLSFHFLYTSSALVQAEEDEARKELSRQFKFLTSKPDEKNLSSLLHDRSAWEKLVAHWRTTATASDRLYLVDPQGRVVALADADSASSPANTTVGQPLKLIRSSAAWGRFGEPIRAWLQDPAGNRLALADSLDTQDGYLVLTRVANDERVSSAQLRIALWLAGGITLVWTSILQAAVLFMIVTRFKQGQSRDQVGPEVEALKRAQALVRTQETVIFGLAKLSDSRDADTGSHLERIAHYSSALAAALRQRPEFREQITPSFVQLIAISSALHDIGKVGVEDSILRKPGALTAEERIRMQCHTQIGEECLTEIERRLGSSNFLQMAREISSAHHERWDGTGYPRGLAGEQIPLSARIVALADVYDALSCKRVYKEALRHELCVEIIAESAGLHFDPRVVEVFLEIEHRFKQISQQFHAPATSSTKETTTFSATETTTLSSARQSSARQHATNGDSADDPAAQFDNLEASLREANE